MSKPALSWKAPEYHHFEKSNDWYWALWIIAIALSIAAFIFGNLLFGLLVILCAVTLHLHAHKPPRILSIELTERGVKVDTLLYPYETLDSFWVSVPHHEHGHHFSHILIKSQKTLMPLIVVPIKEQNPETVREILQKHLVEEEHHEPLGHKILEYLGF